MFHRKKRPSAARIAAIPLCLVALGGCASAGAATAARPSASVAPRSAAPGPTAAPAGFAVPCDAGVIHPGSPASPYLGLTLHKAQARAAAHDQTIMVIGHDGKCLFETPADYDTHRVKVYLVHQVITAASTG